MTKQEELDATIKQEAIDTMADILAIIDNTNFSNADDKALSLRTIKDVASEFIETHEDE